MENKKKRSGMAGGRESYNEKHTDHPWLCSGPVAGLYGGCHRAVPALHLDLGAYSAFLVNLGQSYLLLELIQSEDHQGTQLSSSLSSASSSLDAE